MTSARADSLRSLAFGSITSSYTPLGTPIGHQWRVWKITNTTDGDMLISFDGTTDNLVVPAGAFVLYDIATNADQGAATALTMSVGTQFLVKYSSAPTRGAIYVEGFYQQGQ